MTGGGRCVCDAGHALAFFSELLSGLNHTGPIKSISLLRKRDQKEYWHRAAVLTSCAFVIAIGYSQDRKYG